jgi:hypothetical protein
MIDCAYGRQKENQEESIAIKPNCRSQNKAGEEVAKKEGKFQEEIAEEGASKERYQKDRH